MNGGRVTVLGAGAWGTALALSQARHGRHVTLWGRDATSVNDMITNRRNSAYLPGLVFDTALRATADVSQALDGADVVLAVIPAQKLRDGLSSIAAHIPAGIPIVLCAKGIEQSSGLLMSQVAQQCLPQNPIAALSGPSFATDVARGLPTAVTIAARDETLAIMLAEAISTPQLRCYATDDLTGVEISGALKNVLAIAAGAVRGRALGASAEAALITRGFVELRRIGAALGAKRETMMGLSGLGDLMLTCSSPQSRNLSYGMALGRGENLDHLPLAEGVATAHIAAKEARRLNVEAPIISAVSAILHGKLTIEDAVTSLLARPLKTETN
ncbi:MAG: NAD(P)H-dependent glycerol-3-phosphate dehydrogenase [Rhizobiaceae bacterium]